MLKLFFVSRLFNLKTEQLCCALWHKLYLSPKTENKHTGQKITWLLFIYEVEHITCMWPVILCTKMYNLITKCMFF